MKDLITNMYKFKIYLQNSRVQKPISIFQKKIKKINRPM